MTDSLRNLACFWVGLLAVGCVVETQEATPPRPDCRLDFSCDPDAWTFELRGGGGGPAIPGLRRPRADWNQVAALAVGGTQTLSATASYANPRFETPKFELIVEGAAELVTTTTTTATIRGLRPGTASLSVEQNGRRGSASFTFDFLVREVEDVHIQPVGFAAHGSGAKCLAGVPCWLAVLPVVANTVLSDESLRVSSPQSGLTFAPTPAWNMFSIPPLTPGQYDVTVELGSGQSFSATFETTDVVGDLHLFRGDNVVLEADALPHSVKLCVGAGDHTQDLVSAAEAHFATTDAALTIDRLTVEEPGPFHGYDFGWCRRVTRRGAGPSNITADIRGRQKTFNLRFR